MMESYRRHVLVCTGGYCSPNRGGRELYALLPELLEREGMLFGPDRVKRGETPCLGVCAGGPIVVRFGFEGCDRFGLRARLYLLQRRRSSAFFFARRSRAAIDIQYRGHRRRSLGARAANPDFGAVGELAAVENVVRHRPETRSPGLSAQS